MDRNGCWTIPKAQRRERHLSVLCVWWSTLHNTWPSPKESHIAPNAMSMSVVFLLLVHSCSPSPSNLSHLQNGLIKPIYANQIQRQLTQTHVSHYRCFRDLVPIAHCRLQSLMQFQCWNGRVSCAVYTPSIGSHMRLHHSNTVITRVIVVGNVQSLKQL